MIVDFGFLNEEEEFLVGRGVRVLTTNEREWSRIKIYLFANKVFGGFVVVGEVEGGEVVLEEGLVEFLLFNDSSDISEVALVSGFTVEF